MKPQQLVAAGALALGATLPIVAAAMTVPPLDREWSARQPAPPRFRCATSSVIRIALTTASRPRARTCRSCGVPDELFGREFWEASFKQWGRTMQDDITDGINWLIKEGIADPKRIAIYGASYGGYATLAGVTKTPDLYAAAVNYVGVSNMFTFMNTFRHTGSRCAT